MSWEDFQKGNGENGAPIYIALNGKVLEYNGTKPNDIKRAKEMTMGKDAESI